MCSSDLAPLEELADRLQLLEDRVALLLGERRLRAGVAGEQGERERRERPPHWSCPRISPSGNGGVWMLTYVPPVRNAR